MNVAILINDKKDLNDLIRLLINLENECDFKRCLIELDSEKKTTIIYDERGRTLRVAPKCA